MCVCSVLYKQEIKILLIVRAKIVHMYTCIGNQLMMMMLCKDFVYSDHNFKHLNLCL